MSDPFGLSKQRLQELRLAWEEIRRYTKCKTQTLNLDQFTLLIRSIGIQLSSRDKRTLEREYVIRGEFTFEDLVHLGSAGWTEEVLEESLVMGLRELDKRRTGFVSVSELRQTLYKLGVGIRLSLIEIDAFLEQFEEAKSGKISIDKLVIRLLAD